MTRSIKILEKTYRLFPKLSESLVFSMTVNSKKQNPNRNLFRFLMVRQLGSEPRTLSLKGICSTSPCLRSSRHRALPARRGAGPEPGRSKRWEDMGADTLRRLARKLEPGRSPSAGLDTAGRGRCATGLARAALPPGGYSAQAIAQLTPTWPECRC